MDFAAPEWLWLLLLAPLTGALAAFCWRRRLRATAAWAARGLWDRLLPSYRPGRLRFSVLLLTLALFALALALAQPRWGESNQQVERQGVDVVFVLDTSLSMATQDVQPSRIWVAQTLIRRLVRQIPGNRVALVQAEGEGVVMVPLTLDGAVIDLLLDAVQPGSLPTPGTNLAMAMDKAIGLFPEGSEKHRVMVLLSDGEDHGSQMKQATEALRDAGVLVLAIGVGTPEGKPLELPAEEAGAPLEYKRDKDGNVVVSRLMEDTLEALSRETGGLYMRATSVAIDPTPLADRIRAMETRSYGNEMINTREERFQWPAALAALALFLHLLIPTFAEPEKEL